MIKFFLELYQKLELLLVEKSYFMKKNYAKIGVNTDDDIPLNKQLKCATLTIIIRCIFQNGKKLCPQIYLYDCLYESI